MKALFASLCLALSVQVCFAADEPDTRTPLEKYRGDTQSALLLCKAMLLGALAKGELGEQQDENSDYAGCIATGKATAKASLERALRTIKKAKAQDALKSYHVAFVAALEGIRPGFNERKISYEQRQQALEDKVTEAWARLEVEQ